MQCNLILNGAMWCDVVWLVRCGVVVLWFDVVWWEAVQSGVAQCCVHGTVLCLKLLKCFYR